MEILKGMTGIDETGADLEIAMKVLQAIHCAQSSGGCAAFGQAQGARDRPPQGNTIASILQLCIPPHSFRPGQLPSCIKTLYLKYNSKTHKCATKALSKKSS